MLLPLFVSTGIKYLLICDAICLVLRLCRPMCGKASPYQPALSIDWRLRLRRRRQAQGVAFRPNLFCFSEGQSPSAHQAAEPQEKALVSSCIHTNATLTQSTLPPVLVEKYRFHCICNKAAVTTQLLVTCHLSLVTCHLSLLEMTNANQNTQKRK